MDVHSTKFNILAEIIDYRLTHAYGPTVRELADAVGVDSRSTAQYHIKDLVDQGYLTKLNYNSRTLNPTEKGEKFVALMREYADTPSQS